MGLKISFKCAATGSNPVTVTVSTPHARVDTKTWTNLAEGEITSWYVPLRNIGDYKVHISTNRGYSYDWYIIKLRLNGTDYSDVHWFTQKEVDDLKYGGTFASFVLYSLLISPITAAIGAKSIIGGLLTELGLNIGGLIIADKTMLFHNGFSPESNTGLRFKLVDNGTSYIDCKLQKLERDNYGNRIIKHEESVRRYYDSF
ncbi:hypothetical protein [Brassicibacter mesophilus]|uniref:hypothetical protein n=1 Tax=Brassicibacter mesophilus TaxID=745119 RepID=UPI003D26185D